LAANRLILQPFSLDATVLPGKPCTAYLGGVAIAAFAALDSLLLALHGAPLIPILVHPHAKIMRLSGASPKALFDDVLEISRH
jgi:hypothetical protein